MAWFLINQFLLVVGTCQKKLHCEPRMAAFVGVYDGHDTDSASSYCCKGLVPHILSELMSRSPQRGTSGWSFMGPDRANVPLAFEVQEDPSYSILQVPYIAAFQKAQERFGNKMDPPSFEEITQQMGPVKVAPPVNLNPMSWVAGSSEPLRGGTTACIMSVVRLGSAVCTWRGFV
jgi:hypothetical protein